MKMTENELAVKVKAAINSCLERIPFLSINEITSTVEKEKIQADLWIKLNAPAGYPDIAVEIISNGEPRIVRQTINQLLRYLDYVPNVYGVIVAPYISSKSAEICKEAGIGYVDLSGNCFISFQNVYIEQNGKPNTKLEKKVLQSLYFPKAERILRVLLNNPGTDWKMESLAKEANVSLGLSSKVKQRLEAMEWIDAKSRGFKLKAWDELLDDWQNKYSYTKNHLFDFYTLKSESYIEEQLSDYCQKNNKRFALTMFSGASRIAPYTRFKRVHAYVEKDVDRLKESLDLKTVSSGSNVTIIIPYDDGVFYGIKEFNGIAVVSPIQLYLDLINNKGRGEEAAQFLLKKEIEPKWLENLTLDREK
jgi:hypothetical protein